jgi:[ribosomal protein S5]-alanine N-acetyltransferase
MCARADLSVAAVPSGRLVGVGGRRSVETFRTDRLVAERLRDEHFEEIRRMHQDPAVMTTLGGLRSDGETAGYLRDNLEHWDRYGYGMWVFREGTSGRFVGRAGLRNTRVGGGDEVELAYALVAEYWNRGLATEMARAILGLAFERLGVTDLVCFTLPTNLASRRVMEKAGFTYEREVMHAGLPHVLYRITARG